MNLEGMYQEIILEHYKHPQGKGLRQPFEAEVHHVNPTCGDEITLRAHILDGVLEDVSYDGQGCSISQASASLMFEIVNGQSIESVLNAEDHFLQLMQSKGELHGDEEILGDAVSLSGVSKFPARVKCALLPWMALKDAVIQIQTGKGQ
jgi:nitrogen fixation NifU-like protein